MIKDPEHKLIVEKIDILAKTLDRLYEDYREDRRMRGEMQIELKGVATKTDMTREDIADQHTETKRIVEDGIEDALKPLEKEINKITKNRPKVIHYIHEEKKNLFNKLFRRG